ncbi:MAG: general secretion pathway protein GspK [Nitrospiraceae bacterium]|nr:MAG: general secretion pathway protein GspK [Nitrospiraceae bacterium]
MRPAENQGEAVNTQNTEHRAQSTDNAGSALIITLLIVTILVALVVEFAYEVYIDTTSLSNWENAQKASLIAKSGQALSARYLAELKDRKYTDIGEFTMPVEKDLGPNTQLILRLEDENAKFNINSIIYAENGKTNDKALLSLQRLLEYLEMDTKLALSIADWIDPDSEPRLPDSEDNAKNSHLWNIEELRTVPGIEKSIFDKISPFITVFGDNLININTARLPVIMSLSGDITETLAEQIIAYRESSPFENRTYVQRVSGMESIGITINDRITEKSSSFRITSRATVNEITRIVESVTDTSNKIYFWREG